MELTLASNGYPILDQLSEEGFVDLVFQINQLTRSNDFYELHLLASYNDNLVGLRVRMPSDIHGGFDSEMNLIPANVYHDAVEFFRSGPESDRLVRAVCELYGTDSLSESMVERECFTAIALHQNPIDIAIDAIRLKPFANDKEDDSEEDYYESFLQIDLSTRIISWSEKDTDYRTSLIRGITGS